MGSLQLQRSRKLEDYHACATRIPTGQRNISTLTAECSLFTGSKGKENERETCWLDKTENPNDLCKDKEQKVKE